MPMGKPYVSQITTGMFCEKSTISISDAHLAGTHPVDFPLKFKRLIQFCAFLIDLSPLPIYEI